MEGFTTTVADADTSTSGTISYAITNTKVAPAATVEVNPDEKIASAVRAGIVRKGGYCPCRLPKTPEFFCPCDEFKNQLADSSYHGPCHCRLYVKP